MNYRVEKSVAGNEPIQVAECKSFDAAVVAAEEAGATGEARQRNRGEWCFSGGPEAVGYWITAY